ncbi:hypothetical protein EUGRSUZ_L00922 [Eucalyptus grandis]|uniref:Peptidase S9 prolyl oligopeptidase catalytic domain-containing protein n=1 Tax=Eucalyptus grandis TaxID=71139 RepID=A0A058ZUB6_EUCGR|nr:hypothetical protein EUGRSUZ_L00922 [Eucalyptus grandis]
MGASPSHVPACPPPRAQLHPAPHVRTRLPPCPPPSSSSAAAYKYATADAASPTSAARMDGGAATDAEELRADFLRVLRGRRSDEVELSVEPAKPVENPLYQDANPPSFSEEMQSCPKENIENLKELIKEENVYLITEKGEQGRLPLLIISLKEDIVRKRPAVVFLHSTRKCKEWLRPLLEAYASRGYIAVAVDSRYHGERASSLTTYSEALVSSWKKGDTMPFIFDTVWDLIKLADYLTKREDIDPSRIGITGESLGG